MWRSNFSIILTWFVAIENDTRRGRCVRRSSRQRDLDAGADLADTFYEALSLMIGQGLPCALAKRKLAVGADLAVNGDALLAERLDLRGRT